MKQIVYLAAFICAISTTGRRSDVDAHPVSTGRKLQSDAGSEDTRCATSSLRGYDCQTIIAPRKAELHWSLHQTGSGDASQDHVRFALVCHGVEASRCALAFPEVEGHMSPADAVTGLVRRTGEAAVELYRVTGREATLQSSPPLRESSVERVAGRITLRFSRLLDNGRRVVIDPQQPLWLNWAMFEEEELGHHGLTNRGLVRIHLDSGESENVTTSLYPARVAHGVLMMLAWLLCVPLASVWVRMAQHMDELRLKAHWTLIAVGLLLTTIAAAIALAMFLPVTETFHH
eukprot:gene14358-16981_t